MYWCVQPPVVMAGVAWLVEAAVVIVVAAVTVADVALMVVEEHMGV